MGERGGADSAGPAATGFAIGSDEFMLLSWPVDALKPSAPGGDERYTAAERAVLALVVGGAGNAAIARARGTSLRTVANQVASLLRKSGMSSRLELIARLSRPGHPSTAVGRRCPASARAWP